MEPVEDSSGIDSVVAVMLGDGVKKPSARADEEEEQQRSNEQSRNREDEPRSSPTATTSDTYALQSTSRGGDQEEPGEGDGECDLASLSEVSVPTRAEVLAVCGALLLNLTSRAGRKLEEVSEHFETLCSGWAKTVPSLGSPSTASLRSALGAALKDEQAFLVNYLDVALPALTALVRRHTFASIVEQCMSVFLSKQRSGGPDWLKGIRYQGLKKKNFLRARLLLRMGNVKEGANQQSEFRDEPGRLPTHKTETFLRGEILQLYEGQSLAPSDLAPKAVVREASGAILEIGGALLLRDKLAVCFILLRAFMSDLTAKTEGEFRARMEDFPPSPVDNTEALAKAGVSVELDFCTKLYGLVLEKRRKGKRTPGKWVTERARMSPCAEVVAALHFLGLVLGREAVRGQEHVFGETLASYQSWYRERKILGAFEVPLAKAAVAATRPYRHLVVIARSSLCDPHPSLSSLRRILLDLCGSARIPTSVAALLKEVPRTAVEQLVEIVFVCAAWKILLHEQVVELLRPLSLENHVRALFAKLRERFVQHLELCVDGVHLRAEEFFNICGFMLLGEFLTERKALPMEFGKLRLCPAAQDAVLLSCTEDHLVFMFTQPPATFGGVPRRTCCPVPLVAASQPYPDALGMATSLCAHAEELLRGALFVERFKFLSARMLLADQLANLKDLDRAHLQTMVMRQQIGKMKLQTELDGAKEEIDQLRDQLRHYREMQAATPVLHAGAEGTTEMPSTVHSSAVPVATRSGRDLIERIRTQRGLGFEVGSAPRQVVDSLLRIVAPAVRVLSHDIYKTTFRAFFELLQNSDDCNYESGVTPTVTLTITKEGLLVSNNERDGFRDNEVEAICSIGSSTKLGGHDTTGRKGIGFKSVFSLTKTPEVWSGCFQMRFDSSKLAGEIIPEWTDAHPPVAFPHGSVTNIWLPFAGGNVAPGILADIRSRMAPESLLFLRRVRVVDVFADDGERMQLVCESDGALRTVSRVVGALAAIDSRSFVVVVDPDSSIKVALPLPVWFARLEPESRSFSFATYLPVSDVGFPFVIQGSFLLTANREEVHEEDAENLALRARIAPTVHQALMSRAEFRENLELYLPNPSALSSQWWRVVAYELRELVRRTAAIRCFDGLERPVSEVIVASDEIMSLFPGDEVLRAIGLAYCKADLRGQAVKFYGCTHMSLPQLIECFRILDSGASVYSASWLGRFYAVMASFEERPNPLDLTSLRMFCYSDGRRFSLQEAAPLVPSSMGDSYLFGASVPLLCSDSVPTTQVRVFLAEMLGCSLASDSAVSDAIVQYHVHLGLGGCDGEGVERAWIEEHVRWIQDHPGVISPAKLARVLILPCWNNLGMPSFAPVTSVYFADLPVPRLKATLSELAADAMFFLRINHDDPGAAFYQSLGVAWLPRLIDLDGFLARSGELIALCKILPTREVIELLFEHYEYYSQSGEVLAYLCDLGAPLAESGLFHGTAPWHQVFEAAAVPTALREAVPVLGVALGPHRAKIVSDFGILQKFDQAAVNLVVSNLKRNLHETSLELWRSLYDLCVNAGLACGGGVFVPASVMKTRRVKKVEENCFVALKECAWEGFDVVSRWSRKNYVVLKDLYPASLRALFCPPAIRVQGPSAVKSALQSIWIDPDTSDFRVLEGSEIADAIHLYTMLSEFDPSEFKEAAADEVPMLVEKGRGGKSFFMGPKKARTDLVVIDDADLSKSFRFPLHLSVHHAVSKALTERLGLQKLSQVAISRPTDLAHVKGDQRATWLFRAALCCLKKACIAFLGEQYHISGTVDLFLDRIRVYQQFRVVDTFVNGKRKKSGLDCVSVTSQLTFGEQSWKARRLVPFLWLPSTCALLVPQQYDLANCFERVVATIGPMELRAFVKVKTLHDFESMVEAEFKRSPSIQQPVPFILEEDFPNIAPVRLPALTRKATGGASSGSGIGDGEVFGASGGESGAGFTGLVEPSASTALAVGRTKDSLARVGEAQQDEDASRQPQTGMGLECMREMLLQLRRGEPLGSIAHASFAAGAGIPLASSGLPLSELEEEFLCEIAHHGEAFAFEILTGIAGAKVSWISRFAAQHGAAVTERCDDGAGYDMIVSGCDLGAALLMRFPKCLFIGETRAGRDSILVEVKTHLFPDTTCLVSQNEYQKMQAASARYCFLIVALFPQPQICALVCDPHSAILRGAVESQPVSWQLKLIKK